MDCPKCPGKLETKNVLGVDVDVCHVCEGMWFDKEELEKVINNDSGDFSSFDLAVLDKDNFDGEEIKEILKSVDTMPGNCPCCNVSLKREPSKIKAEVFVDTCPKCKGVWLDGGEIKELRNRFSANLKASVEHWMSFLSAWGRQEKRK